MDPLPVQQKVFRRDRSGRKRRRSGGEQADSESRFERVHGEGRGDFHFSLAVSVQVTVVRW